MDTAGGGLNHTGLGNVDLTAVNNVTAVGTGICIHDAEFDEPNGIIRLRVHTDSTHFSEAAIANIPENTRQDFFIPFSGVNNGLQFVPMGTAGGATFTNVGAVQLEVQSVENAMDGQIGLLNVIGPDSEVENIPNAAPPTAIDIEKFTNGIQADTAGGADVPILIPGNTVTWRYVVSNTGGVSLTNVAVTDDRVGAITNLVSRANGNQDNLLDPGEIWTFEQTGTVVSGSYENKGTVTALGGGQPVMDMDFSHYTAPSPATDIEKSTNGIQADVASGADVPNLVPGNSVTWTYVVSNTSGVPLTNVSVTDDREGAIAGPLSRSSNDNGNNVLNSGEVWTCQRVGTVVSGNYENKATVTALGGGQTVMDLDFSHYTAGAPQIHLEKATNGQDADLPGTGPQVFVGTLVTFNYDVTNTGDVPLSNIVVRDDNATVGNTVDDFFATFANGDTDNDNQLGLTETWTFTATRTATLGTHFNVATVTGQSPNQQQVSDTDPSNHSAVALPSVFSKRRFLASLIQNGIFN